MKLSKLLTYALGSMAVLVMATSCSSSPTLQEYFVSNSENPNFLALDVPANILNLQEVDLDETQVEALRSLRKLNILAFRKTDQNTEAFTTERAKVDAILKNSDFKELMKLNSKFAKGVIKYSGEGDAIDEVVIYGASEDKGFALIRVLGKDMNPAHLVQLMQAVQNADMDGESFKELSDLFSS
ncbi:DUF4252 domain-containing protein [Robiginitalea sp.]|uniref:DUF4252 domain-containing protein n=1 Tax=Robiginitalea sp. TaxID=1902411 RepID=UPI003C74F5EE